ncbi:MAG: phytoene desaturase family protein [Verrucomicrobiota bacterium]
MKREVIVVGAGPGGLATALLLAAGGCKIRILERLDRVGGRTSSIEEAGFRFDVGPTFFLYPRVLELIFEAIGRNLHEEVRMTRLDPQYRVIFGSGGHLDATSNIEAMERQIGALAPQDAGGFRRFMQENRLKLAQFEPCLQTPFRGWRDVLNLRMARLLPLLRPHETLNDSLRRFFSDPRIRLAFCFQSKYLGMSPFQCPSLFSILSFLEYEHGVWHPEGGCNAITKAMARIAAEMGVEICLNEPVKEMEFSGRRATAVRTPRGRYEADAIVINADFAQTMSRLVPDRLRRRWTDRRLAKKTYSCSTFMMYLGVEGRFELPHHSIYISENYERNLAEIERLHLLSEDPSFYVQNAGVTDPGLAPKGMSTLYVLAPVSHQHPNIDWSKEKEKFRAVLLRQIARAGYGDLEERIRFERIVTPQDWEEGHQIYRGATFNLAHSLGQMLHLRPQNRFEDLEGVYLTGGGTHPGSGLPVIFESARITSRLLLKDFGIKPQPRPSLPELSLP